MSMHDRAFVKVVESEGKGLFYKCCYYDYDMKVWDILNWNDYPWYWGFEKLEHALKVVRAYNINAQAQDENEQGAHPRDLAKALALVEVEASRGPEC